MKPFTLNKFALSKISSVAKAKCCTPAPNLSSTNTPANVFKSADAFKFKRTSPSGLSIAWLKIIPDGSLTFTIEDLSISKVDI